MLITKPFGVFVFSFFQEWTFVGVESEIRWVLLKGMMSSNSRWAPRLFSIYDDNLRDPIRLYRKHDDRDSLSSFSSFLCHHH